MILPPFTAQADDRRPRGGRAETEGPADSTRSLRAVGCSMGIEPRSFRRQTNPSPIAVEPASRHAQVQEEEASKCHFGSSPRRGAASTQPVLFLFLLVRTIPGRSELRVARCAATRISIYDINTLTARSVLWVYIYIYIYIYI
jgi:hypothetical protein